MKKLLLVGLFLGGLVLGAIAGGWWSWHVFSRLIVSKEVDAASYAAFQAEWLADLRPGDTQGAIKDIEKTMDSQVANLAEWNEAHPLDEKIRKAPDRWLMPVKVYHESYPVSGDDADQITAFLASIPSRNPKGISMSGISRLDDFRRAQLRPATNSPR